MGKVISAHAVMFLEVADDGLDGGPPVEFALDLRRDAALLAARVDLELVIGWGVVAAIAGIGDAAIEYVADERLHLRNDPAERVPVLGVAGQCCGVGDELPAGGMLYRGGDAHLDPELVRPGVLCPCRCTRPLARAGNRPCGRAGGAPVPARAGPGTGAVRMLPANLPSRPFAARCRA